MELGPKKDQGPAPPRARLPSIEGSMQPFLLIRVSLLGPWGESDY